MKKINLFFICFILYLLNNFLFSQVEIVSTGSSTAYIVNIPGVFPLRNGIEINFRAHVACGANPTLDVSGTGPTAITKNGNSTNLASGDIAANQIVKVVYDGSKWQLISPTANTSNGTVTSVSFSVAAAIGTVSGSPITSTGTISVAPPSVSPNTVYSGPSSGIAGPASWRSLVANDIPSLDASKITTGVLPLSLGGTGTSLTAVNGGMVYSGSSGFGITSAGTSGQVLQSNGTSAPTWVSPSFLPSGISGQTLRHDGTGWLANSFLFNDGTKIGVGTTSPPTLMSISTGFAPLYSTILSSAATTNSTTLGGIYFADTQLPGTAQAGIYGYRDGASSSSSDLPTRLSFYTTSDGSSATTERVRIDNTGNVGIGDGINGGVSSRFFVSDATSNRLVSLIQSETGSTSTTLIGGTLGLKVGISSDGTEQKTGISAVVTGSGTGQQNALFGEAQGSGTGSWNRGVVGAASNNTNSNVGGDFFSNGNSGTNTAIRATTGGTQASSKFGLYISSSGAGTRYGVYTVGEDINYFSNKLGIGTTSPGATLHVAGTARITSLIGPGTVIADASGNLSVATGGTTTGSGTQNYVARWTSGSTLGTGVLMDDGVNVGIGATSTSDMLGKLTVRKSVSTVDGTSGVFIDLINDAVNTAGTLTGIRFSNYPANTTNPYLPGGIVWKSDGGTFGRGDICFVTGTTGGAANVNTNTRMVISSVGNIGVGTVSPARKLHVVDGGTSGATPDGNSIAVFEDNANSYISLLTASANENGILFGNSSSSQDGGIIFNNTANAHGLQFRTNGNQTRMVITSGGYVGIGTTSPAAGLVVSGTGLWSSAIGLENTASAMEWRMSVDNNKIFGVSKVTGTTFTPFQLFSDGQVEFPNSSGLTRLRILDNGNVGIGTSAPGQNLDVIGRLKFRSDGSSSAGFWLTDNTGNENVFSGLTNINSTDSWGIWSGNAWRLTVSNLGEVGIGIGSNAPSARLDVRTNTASAKTIYGENFFSGTWDGYGVYGQSTNNPGYGFGVYGSGSYRGVYGVSDGTTYTGGTIGVYGSALGTAGTRYGVFGYAQGGTTNYGVYCNRSEEHTSELQSH